MFIGVPSEDRTISSVIRVQCLKHTNQWLPKVKKSWWSLLLHVNWRERKKNFAINWIIKKSYSELSKSKTIPFSLDNLWWLARLVAFIFVVFFICFNFFFVWLHQLCQFFFFFFFFFFVKQISPSQAGKLSEKSIERAPNQITSIFFLSDPRTRVGGGLGGVRPGGLGAMSSLHQIFFADDLLFFFLFF